MVKIIYRLPTGETRVFTIEGKEFKFKGGYYFGKKGDRKYLEKVNLAFPVVDESGKQINTLMSERVEYKPEPLPEPPEAIESTEE